MAIFNWSAPEREARLRMFQEIMMQTEYNQIEESLMLESLERQFYFFYNDEARFEATLKEFLDEIEDWSQIPVTRARIEFYIRKGRQG